MQPPPQRTGMSVPAVLGLVAGLIFTGLVILAVIGFIIGFIIGEPPDEPKPTQAAAPATSQSPTPSTPTRQTQPAPAPTPSRAPVTAKPSPPWVLQYKVVEESGRNIVVEVDAMPPGNGLRAIFDDVRKKDRDDGGYFVSINCSTGGTKSADNRLANGRFAVGALGAAQTGLDEGAAEFEANAGRTCPAAP